MQLWGLVGKKAPFFCVNAVYAIGRRGKLQATRVVPPDVESWERQREAPRACQACQLFAPKGPKGPQ